MQGLAQYAREQNWHLVTDVIHTGVVPHRWEGDGIIALACYGHEGVTDAMPAGVPCVTVSLAAESRARPRVEPDQREIGRLAAKHLLERGCRDFVWAPFLDDLPNRQQFEGFHAVIGPEGFNCRLLPPAHRRLGRAWHDNEQEWRHALRDVFTSLSQPTGLFANNDSLCGRVLAAAEAAHIAVPRQLALLGVGNDPADCGSAPIPLSTIALNELQVAHRAAETLQRLLEGQAPDSAVVLVPPQGAITRESTGIEPEHDSRIQQAATFISQHSADPRLGVVMVAEQVGISRRQLERDFRKLKGCTVREYIEETRMLLAARILLDQPQTKVLTIADSIGISDPNSFFRKFRKRFGLTPAAYRREHAAT